VPSPRGNLSELTLRLASTFEAFTTRIKFSNPLHGRCLTYILGRKSVWTMPGGSIRMFRLLREELALATASARAHAMLLSGLKISFLSRGISIV
jgi:hypothetical protein